MKKRILFVLHLPPPCHGAAVMGAYLRDSRLVRDAFDCRFLNLSTSVSLQEIGRRSFRKVISFIRILLDVIRLGCGWKPDLVYVTPTSRFPGFIKDYLIVQTAKILGKPVVLHFHNTGVSLGQKRYQKRMYRRFFRGTQVILLSELLYEDIKAYVPRSRVFICPNGLPDLFEGCPPQRERGETVRLLFLSNLLIAKGIFVFLDACQLLQERGLSFSGRIVGGETGEVDASRLQAAISERRLSDVLYLGPLSGTAKRDVLADSDVFVFPSLDEAFGLVLLEAAQAEIPAVASKVGGIPDVVADGESGMLVRPGQPEELADALERLISDADLRARMGWEARRRWEAGGTLAAFENRMKSILTSLMP